MNNRLNQKTPVTLFFPSKIVGGAILLMILVVVWMSWVIFDASRFAELTKTHYLTLERLHGEILQYDEVLTMSARMAAATGDKSWIDRYLQYEPLLGKAITEAISLSQSSDMADAARLTDIANVELIMLENRSFELVEEGRLEEAQALLTSDAYNHQKSVYAEGMRNLLKLLQDVINKRTSDQQNKNALSIGAIVFLLCISIITWIAVFRSVNQWHTALALSVVKRTEAEKALNKSHNELEYKVRERTDKLKGEINERKQTEEALKESEARFRDFAASTSDWFWEMDDHLRFTYFSARNQEITGFDPTIYIGKTRREIAAESTTDEKWSQHMDDLDNHQSFRDFRYDLTRLDGSRLTISISGKPRFDHTENFLGYRGTGTDITSQRLAEETRDEALRESEQANQAKSEFLATMSHEFRTPLNAILGFSEMMRAQYFGPLGSANYKDYANDIFNSGKHMLALVNDVLDIAAIEAGKRAMSNEAITFNELLTDCVRKLEQIAKDGEIGLSCNVSVDLPILYADKRSITQIIFNLLSNAIKFTKQNGTIIVSGINVDQKLIIQVTDTGIGIPSDKLDRITEPFSQAHTNPHMTQQGTGLGLSIVEALVDAHDGELKIESEIGKGTTVTVTIPFLGTEIEK